MKKQNVKATFGQHEIRLALFSYIDEGVHVLYAPALDLFGYGDQEDQAIESFETVLKEYIDYVVNHKTLEKDLKKHGWKPDKQRQIYLAPAFHELMLRDETFYEIITQRPFRKFDRIVQLPFAAA